MSRSETSYRRFNSRYIKSIEQNFPLLNEYPVTDINIALSEVLVNPRAADFLPAEYQYMCTPEFVAQFALMTCPDNLGSQNHVTGYAFTPRRWTRSLTPIHIPDPIYYGPDKQVFGSIVQTKGNLYTGHMYGNARLKGNDPWGYFGLKEASMEESIGNKLLENGFHAGLVLGTCVIDPASLETMINEVYRFHHPLRVSLLQNLNKVANNNDVPVVMVRLTDTFSRMNDVIEELNPHILLDAENHFGHFDPALRESMLAVTQSGGNDFPYEQDIKNLLEYLEKFVANNSEALMKALQKNPELKQYPSLESCLATKKDIGLRCVAVDFEQSIETRPQSLVINALLNRKPPTYYDQMLVNLKEHHYNVLTKLYKKYRPPIDKTAADKLSLYLQKHLQIDFPL